MRRVIQQNQNNSKALEVRLEQQAQGIFCVILAGITFNLQTGCAGGKCEFTGEGGYLYLENETYMQHQFANYEEAKTAYDAFRQQYL
jgi:hypothetical protein